jgi:hypothetical protein
MKLDGEPGNSNLYRLYRSGNVAIGATKQQRPTKAIDDPPLTVGHQQSAIHESTAKN